MISRQGQVKLTDFGIAKAATQVHVTELGETKGTPSMMAPEQRMGKVVDGRADVYSTAAVGYEMFTGQVVNLDLAASLHRGIVGWPHLAPPTQVRADLPAELDELLLGALAFEPEARPESSDALEDKLAAIVTKHNLVVDEKAIARWIESELALLPDESALGISATQSA